MKSSLWSEGQRILCYILNVLPPNGQKRQRGLLIIFLLPSLHGSILDMDLIDSNGSSGGVGRALSPLRLCWQIYWTDLKPILMWDWGEWNIPNSEAVGTSCLVSTLSSNSAPDLRQRYFTPNPPSPHTHTWQPILSCREAGQFTRGLLHAKRPLCPLSYSPSPSPAALVNENPNSECCKKKDKIVRTLALWVPFFGILNENMKQLLYE